MFVFLLWEFTAGRTDKQRTCVCVEQSALRKASNVRYLLVCAQDGIESVEDAALMLLGVGPEVDILDPPALRRHLAEQAEAIAQRSR